jgi:hypothetical protein
VQYDGWCQNDLGQNRQQRALAEENGGEKKKVNLPIGQCQSEDYFEKWTKKGMIVGSGHK